MISRCSLKFFTRALCLLLLLGLWLSSAAAAPASNLLGSLQAEFKRLNQTDADVQNLEAWDKLAGKVAGLIESESGRAETPEAYFLLGRVSEATFKARRFQPALSRALDAYQTLAGKYPHHKLTGDALLALGELQQNELEDLPAAKRSFQAVVQAHAGEDARQAAGAHLAQIKQLELDEQNKSAFTLGDLGAGRFHLFKLKPKPGKSQQVVVGRPSFSRPLIVIDPGHGGEDEGAIGIKGVEEKDVTLNIALMLDEMLRDRLRARTVLTRVRDVVVALPDRTQLANDERADLFVSIHANASPARRASGIETYYLDNTHEQSSLKLAERENASLKYGGSGGDLGFIVSDLIQNVKLEDSIALAHHVQSQLVGTLKQRYADVRDLGVKKAPFFVLVGAHMPCILAEVSFIDHPVEGARLITRDYQKLVAEALFKGIREYYEKVQQ